jgi:hypothetical protein
MRKRERTRTTIEKREVLMIKRSRSLTRALCTECAEPTVLVTLNEAVRISGLGSRAIYRLIESEQVHSLEVADGLTLICPVTLLQRGSGID